MYIRNTDEHYGGSGLLQSTDLNVNASIKVIRNVTIQIYIFLSKSEPYMHATSDKHLCALLCFAAAKLYSPL